MNSKSQKKKRNKKVLSNFLFFLILTYNFIPVIGGVVLAEEDTHPEVVVEEMVVEEDVLDEPQVVLEPEPIEENIPETEIAGTSTPILGFETLATSTEGTTTISNSTTTELLSLLEIGTSTEDLELPIGTTTIDTGDAIATANILNLANTNSINSTGTIQMVNLTEEQNSDLDFRDGHITGSDSTCSVTDCSGVENITAQIQDDAIIENVLAIQAGSGGNTIETSGGAVINTGNTAAGLNLVNIANTNIIDSNYFVLTLNSFHDVNGDIVLPGLAQFFSSLSGLSGENININTSQLADVQNNLGVIANTGDNEAENSLTSTINTGDSNSLTNIYNSLNTNLFGGKSIRILLHVAGNWLGEFLGLPEGVTLTREGNLYALEIAGENGTNENLQNLEIQSTSTAQIINDVNLLADSGNNYTFDTNNSYVNTGDSLAAANVVNIANTNIVGKDWMLAVINIFGDFNGDIVFGRPDLFVSQDYSADGYVQNDNYIDFKINISNKGDREAPNSQAVLKYDLAHLDIVEASLPYVINDQDELIFHLGNLQARENREIFVTGKIKNTSPGQTILNTITLISNEKDNNQNDNVNTLSLNTYLPNIGGSGGGYFLPASTNQNLEAQNNFILNINNFSVYRDLPEIILLSASSSAHQKIVLSNLSDKKIEKVIFDDILYDGNGVEVQRESWELGDILAREEIELNYDVSFGDKIRNGTYSLSSELHYADSQKIIFGNNGKIILQIENVILALQDFSEVQENIITKNSIEKKVDNAYMFISGTTTLALADTGDEIGPSTSYQQTSKMNFQDIYYSLLNIFSFFLSSFSLLLKKIII